MVLVELARRVLSRLGPDPAAPPLVDGSQWAFEGPYSLRGSVDREDILVEYSAQSIDGGVHNREVIRHYKIMGDEAKRLDPLALSPRDFVDEWLTHDWISEAALWSESTHRVALRDTYKRLHKDMMFGSFLGPTMHCSAAPDLWAVGVDLSDPPTPSKEAKGVYFLVRWRPPYRFTMVDVSDHPYPTCSKKDSEADERRSLFPPRN